MQESNEGKTRRVCGVSEKEESKAVKVWRFCGGEADVLGGC